MSNNTKVNNIFRSYKMGLNGIYHTIMALWDVLLRDDPETCYQTAEDLFLKLSDKDKDV